MLRTRVIVAIVLIPLVVGCLYLGGIPWLLGVLLAGVLAWLEMAGILQREQFTVDRNLGWFFIVGAIVEAYLHSTFPGQYDLVRPLLAALIIFSLIWALYNKGEHPTADWGVTVASALYLGVTISYLVALRQRSNGFNWAIAAFVITWACDAMAYFVGRSFGKHKLWPRISPKKTWAGILSGWAGAIALGAMLWAAGQADWTLVPFSALTAFASQMGDIGESALKRRAGVKDASALIPGHGGVMDRFDGLSGAILFVLAWAIVMPVPAVGA